MSGITLNKDLGRLARSGDFAEQLIPTYTKIAEAIKACDGESAKQYIDFFDVEAAVCYKLFDQWVVDIERFLTEKGMSAAELDGVRLDLTLLVNRGYFGRDDYDAYDRRQERLEYMSMKAKLCRYLNAPPEEALNVLAAFKDKWCSIHDRDVDLLSGLLNTVHLHHGDIAIGEVIRDYVIGNLFSFRYERFDVSKKKWEDSFKTLVYLSIESMRGHLVGPERDGTMGLVEDDEKVTITFAPCGSGGRISAGDTLHGTPSRHEAPYYFKMMENKYDFSWKKSGVCHYCVHCSVLVEKIPMERFGYPLRVVEPPVYPDHTKVCKWTMYKNPRNVPEWVYERMGEKKPLQDEPLGSATRRQGKLGNVKAMDGSKLL